MAKTELRKSLEIEAAEGSEPSSIVMRLLESSELSYVSGGSHIQSGGGSFTQNAGTHTQTGTGSFTQNAGGYNQSSSGNYSKYSWDDYLEGDG
ncbi:hypothetical protein QO010_004018 [Caulobacter ginsengisoli]|uniref:Uncharacterized protein n=1 Tax=Caulobacter ginsengisoli TaxID=400775 RepID=A0ABU0IW26_9CAUL|nr:hypothetical protein [Caulobacter ginsengisoli]MDQ0466225.1 hypothetical protein [Caulobacter ginsengisoli]